MDRCPCGLDKTYDECCGKFHTKQAQASSAEELMRSRYSAFAKGEIDYLVSTIPLLDRKSFDRGSAKKWSNESEWLGLEVLSSKGVGEDKHGKVEFKARYKQNDKERLLHEISRFEQIKGRWFYIGGKIVEVT